MGAELAVNCRVSVAALTYSCHFIPSVLLPAADLEFPASSERISFWMAFRWVRRVTSLSTAVVEEEPAGPVGFPDASRWQDRTESLLVRKILSPMQFALKPDNPILSETREVRSMPCKRMKKQ